MAACPNHKVSLPGRETPRVAMRVQQGRVIALNTYGPLSKAPVQGCRLPSQALNTSCPRPRPRRPFDWTISCPGHPSKATAPAEAPACTHPSRLWLLNTCTHPSSPRPRFRREARLVRGRYSPSPQGRRRGPERSETMRREKMGVGGGAGPAQGRLPLPPRARLREPARPRRRHHTPFRVRPGCLPAPACRLASRAPSSTSICGRAGSRSCPDLAAHPGVGVREAPSVAPPSR